MTFTPRVINEELDIANLNKHNDNYSDIKTEFDNQGSRLNDLEVEQAEQKERIDNIVSQSGDDITEIVDARKPVSGAAYATLGDRLNASDNRITVSASPPTGTPSVNAIWYEDLGESPDLGGGGLIIANASLDGTNDIWFATET